MNLHVLDTVHTQNGGQFSHRPDQIQIPTFRLLKGLQSSSKSLKSLSIEKLSNFPSMDDDLFPIYAEFAEVISSFPLLEHLRGDSTQLLTISLGASMRGFPSTLKTIELAANHEYTKENQFTPARFKPAEGIFLQLLDRNCLPKGFKAFKTHKEYVVGNPYFKGLLEKNPRDLREFKEVREFLVKGAGRKGIKVEFI